MSEKGQNQPEKLVFRNTFLGQLPPAKLLLLPQLHCLFSFAAVMGESGLYESIRTGKFEDVPPGVEPTAGDGTNGGEGTSQPVVPPRPPNIENMSRAEK